jgi:predicted AAA+ superfamily ATPase
LLASRTAGLLSFADLSRSLSVAQTTVKRYVALLEATFLVVMLPAWSTNRGLRLSKAPKVMLSDSGLCCHLLASDAARLAADGHARGIILENFVAMELLKQLSWSGVRAKLHHFRTSGGHEVDLVLEDLAGRVVGIEVKSAGSVHSDDFKGLRVLREATGEKFVRGLVLYCGREAIAFDGDLAAVPMNNLWA